MSKYTTEVRFICENYSGLDDSVGYSNVEDVIANSRAKVFDFYYPIYDESYRSVIETKILKHFYTREIGAESVALWKLWLNTRMNEIMPYYNQLYKSALIEFNPLFDTDYTTTHDGQSSGTSDDSVSENTTDTKNYQTTDSGTNTSEESIESSTENELNGTTGISGTNTNSHNGNKWQYYSDTPQGGINGIDNMTYLTNVTHETNVSSDSATNNEENSINQTNNTEQTTTTTNTNTINITKNETGNGTRNRSENKESEFNNTDNYIEHICGKRGTNSYSNMLLEFRKSLINVDTMVINELSDLFMNVW